MKEEGKGRGKRETREKHQWWIMSLAYGRIISCTLYTYIVYFCFIATVWQLSSDPGCPWLALLAPKLPTLHPSSPPPTLRFPSKDAATAALDIMKCAYCSSSYCDDGS